MGIFTDIATSSGGALLQGVLDEADNIARQDAQTNAVVAQNALDKENEAFKLTELAFKNREQLTKDFINNAGELGIVAGELTIDQIADRLVGSIFNNQRSIFEQKDYKLVSRDVAKFLARDMGKEIEINNPYIPAQDLFNQEKEKHSARLSAISKMPNVDKLSHNIEKAEAKVESPEVMFSKAMTIAPISAKAYGILGYYPDTKEGRDALAFQKTSLIVANARFYHPDDPMARAQFMERKLYENQIDPFAALQFKNPMNFRQITSVLDQMSKNTSTQMLMLTNKMNNPDLTEEGRLEIKGQIDQLTLEQMKQVNNASGIAIMQMARQNVPVDQSMISTEAPIVDDGSTGAQIETGERKIKPQRFGTKRKTITQDEPKQQPKKKESILTPGLKLKKDKKDDEVDTTEEIKGTTTKPNPGSGGIRGSRGTKKRGTVKVDEQKQEAMIESGDLPVKQASLKENVGEGAITFTKLINNNNMNTAYNSLRSKLNSKASAAILGNIYAENDTFKFNREEEGDINKLKDKERGYGLFQFTNYKDKESGEIVGHRKEYFNYLENTGKEDSIQSQVDYVLDNIYNGVGFNIGETNRETLRESFKNDSVKEIADKFMRIFENPKVKNLDKRSNFGLEAYEYYTTIQDMS
jgi:hypothetical protein